MSVMNKLSKLCLHTPEPNEEFSFTNVWTWYVHTGCWEKELSSASMISCDESQSDGECSEPDLSSFYMIGKKFIYRGRWTKQEVKFAEISNLLIFSKQLRSCQVRWYLVRTEQYEIYNSNKWSHKRKGKKSAEI